MAGPLASLLMEQLDTVWEKEGWQAPLKDALGGLTADQARWTPDPGTHTAWQVANHIRFWTDDVVRRLTPSAEPAGDVDNARTFSQGTDEVAWQGTVDELGRTFAALRGIVAGLSDADLVAGGGSARGYLVGVVTHTAYHAGQIMTLRKLQGSWPETR